MRSCDLFALSSLWEGFGIVTVEALAFGVNIVAVDCPHGPSEILDGNRFGRLVPMFDEDELAEALVLALDNPKPERDLMKRATEFGLGASIQTYVDLVEEFDPSLSMQTK